MFRFLGPLATSIKAIWNDFFFHVWIVGYHYRVKRVRGHDYLSPIFFIRKMHIWSLYAFWLHQKLVLWHPGYIKNKVFTWWFLVCAFFFLQLYIFCDIFLKYTCVTLVNWNACFYFTNYYHGCITIFIRMARTPQRIAAQLAAKADKGDKSKKHNKKREHKEVVTEELDAFVNFLDVNVPRPLLAEPDIVILSSTLSPQEIQFPRSIWTHFTFTSESQFPFSVVQIRCSVFSAAVCVLTVSWCVLWSPQCTHILIYMQTRRHLKTDGLVCLCNSSLDFVN